MKYKIYRSSDSFALGQLVKEADDINTRLESQPDGKFYYKFTETNDYGTSKPSSPIEVVTIAPATPPVVTNGIGKVTVTVPEIIGAGTYRVEGRINQSAEYAHVYEGTNRTFEITNEADFYPYMRTWATSGWDEAGAISTGNKSEDYEYIPPALTTPVLSINTSGENLVFTYSGCDEALEVRLEDQSGTVIGTFDLTTKSLTRARPASNLTYYAIAKAGFVEVKSVGVAYEYKTGARNFKATVNSTTKAIDLTWDAPYGHFHDSYQIAYKLSSDSNWTLINDIGKSVSSYSIPLKANGTYDVKINTVYGSYYEQGMEVKGLVVNLIAVGSTPSAVNAVGAVSINCTLPNGADAVHLEGSNDKNSWVKVNTGTSYAVTSVGALYKYWRSYGTFNNRFIGETGAVFEYIAPSITTPVLSINTSTANLIFTYTGGDGALEMRLENATGASLGQFDRTAKSLTIERPDAVITYHAVGQAGFVTVKSTGVAYDYKIGARNLKAEVNSMTKEIDLTWDSPYGGFQDSFQIGHKLSSDSAWTWINNVSKTATSYSIPLKANGTYDVKINTVYGTHYQQGLEVKGLVANLIAAGSTPTAVNTVGTVTVSCTIPDGADAVHLEGSNDKSSWFMVHTGTSYAVKTTGALYKYWRSYGSFNNVYIGPAGGEFEYKAPSIAALTLSLTDPATGQLNFTYSGGGGALQVNLCDTGGTDHGAFSGTAKSITAPTTSKTFYAKGSAGLVTAQSANVAYNAYVPVRNASASFNATTKKIVANWSPPYNSTFERIAVNYRLNTQTEWTHVGSVYKGTNTITIDPQLGSGTYQIQLVATYPGTVYAQAVEIYGIVVILDGMLLDTQNFPSNANAQTFNIPAYCGYIRYTFTIPGGGSGGSAVSMDESATAWGGDAAEACTINLINGSASLNGFYTTKGGAGGTGSTSWSGACAGGGGGSAFFAGQASQDGFAGGSKGTYVPSPASNLGWTSRISSTNSNIANGGAAVTEDRTSGAGGNGGIVYGDFKLNSQSSALQISLIVGRGGSGGSTRSDYYSISGKNGGNGYCIVQFWSTEPTHNNWPNPVT